MSIVDGEVLVADAAALVAVVAAVAAVAAVIKRKKIETRVETRVYILILRLGLFCYVEKKNSTFSTINRQSHIFYTIDQQTSMVHVAHADF